jgi:hypothetical protein
VTNIPPPTTGDYRRAEVDHETIALTARTWSEFLVDIDSVPIVAVEQLDEMFDRHYSRSCSCNQRW